MYKTPQNTGTFISNLYNLLQSSVSIKKKKKAKDRIVWIKRLRFLEELEMSIIGQRDTQLK